MTVGIWRTRGAAGEVQVAEAALPESLTFLTHNLSLYCPMVMLLPAEDKGQDYLELSRIMQCRCWRPKVTTTINLPSVGTGTREGDVPGTRDCWSSAMRPDSPSCGRRSKFPYRDTVAAGSATIAAMRCARIMTGRSTIFPSIEMAPPLDSRDASSTRCAHAISNSVGA